MGTALIAMSLLFVIWTLRVTVLCLNRGSFAVPHGPDTAAPAADLATPHA
ncbi:hypothetical protein LA6_001589 [Marinibacterium anthonyi]|nr:hypothetical protein LA6_001589 [Marinibacterium anthonyi]